MESTDDFLARLILESDKLDLSLANGRLTVEEHRELKASLWAQDMPEPDRSSLAEWAAIKAENQESDSRFATLMSEPHTALDEEFIRNEYGIGIDRSGRRVALISHGYRTFVGYEKLVSSEVCVDSETVVKTGRGGQLGAALVGGALFGGVGALIGAMGATKKSLNSIRTIELKLLTTEPHRPIHTISFYDSKARDTADRALKNAESWHDRMTVSIREAELEARAKTAQGQYSLGAELEKLAELKSKGVLTVAEFDAAKQKLLLAG